MNILTAADPSLSRHLNLWARFPRPLLSLLGRVLIALFRDGKIGGKYGYKLPVSVSPPTTTTTLCLSVSFFFFFQTGPHTCTELVWQQLTESGKEVVPFWLEFGTTVNLIRVEMDHMAGWEAGGSPAERLVCGESPINNQGSEWGHMHAADRENTQ